MAAYADIAFATQLYGASYITTAFDRDGDGEIDTLDAELMFEIASAEIDSFLVGKIEMPLTTVPLDLKMRCVDIAVYRMCPDAATATVEKRTRFEAAQKWLEMVATNRIKLTAAPLTGEPLTGAHLTQRATVVTAAAAHYDQQENSRWFSRERTRRGDF